MSENMKVADSRMDNDPFSSARTTAISIGVVSIDLHGTIAGMNAQGMALFESIAGESVCGKNPADISALKTAGISQNIQECLASSASGAFNAHLRTLWGHEMHLRYHVSPVKNDSGSVSSVQLIFEIPEQKEDANKHLPAPPVAEYSIRLRRMTHDFNNVLSGILGYAELALLTAEENSETHDNLRECINAGLRAKNLVQELIELNRQTFGKRQ